MRIRDPDLLRLLHFDYDECVLCGRTHPLHLHHVLFRSHGGDDVRANLLALCFQCHEGYHLRRQDGYGARLVTYIHAERPDTYAYLVDKLGALGAEHWFHSHASG